MITVPVGGHRRRRLLTGLVNEYQLERFAVFFDQNSNDPRLKDVLYQGRNAIRALATGGITGKGWLQGPITNAETTSPCSGPTSRSPRLASSSA